MSPRGSLLSVAWIAAGFSVIAAAPVDRKLGAWKLDIAASHLAGPAPGEDLRTYRRTANGMTRSTHRTTNADGSVATTIYEARDDGREYPMHDADGKQTGTIAFAPHAPGEAQTFVTRRGGKITVRGRTSISLDGRSKTIAMQAGEDPGNAREILTIFRRVGDE